MNFYEMKYQENNIGFSIIELLVVIALIAILTLVGYPNFAEYNKKKQIKTAVYKLYEHLQTYQQFAVTYKRRYRVNVPKGENSISIETKYAEDVKCATMTRDGNYLRDSEFINSETMKLSNTKVTSGGTQDLCSDTCDGKGSEFSGVYELEHQSGSKFGKYRITISKGTCYMKLEEYKNNKWEEIN